MKAAEVRRLSIEELNQRLTDLSDELFRLKFQLISGQLQNYKRINQVKKDKARMKTIIRERELQINQSLPEAEAAMAEE
ncbi:50S ribosomal protein L29 [Candidatus Poribacteria bacterium]|nr:50S ribosomal protein L29 [Candidatus Poribacteria bacterium]